MPQLEGVVHRDVTVDGVRVHVAEAGQGPAIVLQHGWPQHWWAWRAQIAALAASHRVVAPDLRGFGWSQAPPGASYAQERLADDLLGVLDALELERVLLVGQDWGAFAGFLACLRAPERFSGFLALAIVHPWIRPSLDPRQFARVLYQVPIATPGVGGPLLRRRALARRFVELAGDGVWDADTVELYAGALSSPGTSRATVALYRTFLTRELPALRRGRYASAHLRVPTRLLVGEADPVIARNGIRGWEGHAQDMRVEWIPGAGHWLSEQRPELVLERIRELA